MGCDECDKYNDGQKGIAYYRWKTANIGMLGCPTHLREIIDALNKIQEVKK